MKFDKNINWTELAIKTGAGIWSGGAILSNFITGNKNEK